MIKESIITDNYAIYNADCMDVISEMPNESTDLIIYSPPFAGLYNYSSDARDFSNCDSPDAFLKQYEFLVSQLSRILKKGRVACVHCQDIVLSVANHTLYDLPSEIIKIHLNYGFDYKNRITVWKEPLKVRMRTMVKSLMHKTVVEDATSAFTANPDYVLIFRRKGECETPVTHTKGFNRYFGESPMIMDMESQYGKFEYLQKKYKNWDDPSTNKLSHIIWQRYASSVWDDIRIDNVLPYKDSKEEDDEKHVHPLQLDVIDRLVELYSNENEVILTPFMGVGSEVYSPVSLKRKGVGIELKPSYFKQAKLNMAAALDRFQSDTQLTLV